MKKYFLSIGIVLYSLLSIAQSPQGFKYQAVVRDSGGEPISSQKVSFRVSVLQGSVSGDVSYIETHAPTTSSFGLVDMVIGNGSSVSGSFEGIDWGSNDFFLKLEIDKNGGSNYQLMGTSQLLSVPYALHAETVSEKQTLSVNGNKLSISGGNEVELLTNNQSSVLMLTGDVTNAQAIDMIDLMDVISHVFIGNTTALTTVDLSALTNVVEINIMNNESLSSVDFSNLETVFSEITIKNSPITELDLGNLLTTGSQYMTIQQTELTSLDLSSMTNSFLDIYDNSLLTSIQLGDYDGTTDFNISNNALSVTAINEILAHLAAITPAVSGRSYSMANQTPEAEPTGQGLTDLETLRNNGNAVSVDGSNSQLLTQGPAIFSSVVEPADATTLDWTGMEVQFSGDENGGTYTTTNSADLTVWPASGSWSFNNSEETEIIRGDGVVMSYSIENTILSIDFTIESSGAIAANLAAVEGVLVIDGYWQFEFDFN